MNLLCPNCSKMLTVPEQYAGQLMKCPLCSGTFTVPALPPGGSLDAPAPPPAPPQPAFSQTPASSDPYHLQQLKPFFHFTDDDELATLNKERKDNPIKDNRPGVSVLLIFYLLFFIATLLATVAVVVLPFVQMQLPPQVQQLLPWKWAIVAA